MGNTLSNLLGCSSQNTGCNTKCYSKNNSLRNSSNVPYHIINDSGKEYFEI